MRTVTKSWALGLSLLLAACSGADAEAPADAPAAEATVPAASAPAPGTTPAAITPAGTTPEPEAAMPDPEVDAAPEADAGAPVDAGGSGSGGQQIPKPASGKLLASSKTGDLCQFSVDGYAKGSSTTLEIALLVGEHVVSCKRPDGKVASDAVTISANTMTTVVLEFPLDLTNGTLVAVAVGGSCAFSVNGAAKGTSTQLKLSVPPGAYSVTCKPATGATKSRSVIVKSGESAMAMFQLN